MQQLIYFFALVILTSGLFIMLTSDNYVRKIIGLGVFQSSVLIFYLALGKVHGGIVPIEHDHIVIQEDSSQLDESQNFSHQLNTYANCLANDQLSHPEFIARSLNMEDLKQVQDDTKLRPVKSRIIYNYSSPIPHVLMLTAIVVGFATLSVGLALIYRISQQFNTILESKISS